MFCNDLLTESIHQSISKSGFSNNGSSKNCAVVISSPRMICITVFKFTPLLRSRISVFIVLCGIAMFFSKRYCDIFFSLKILLIRNATAVLNFMRSPMVVFTTIILSKIILNTGVHLQPL